ncbi:alanyl-tRNA editing protein [Candidatus Woesearchaeota archaeon]|nr:alanyl-tRNA editing protein [Candidatus Woesearchaeota archaeon]
MLYLKDSYKKEFEAIVKEVNANKIVLNETYFYASGGGQPSDKGIIIFNNQEFKVINVKKENGKIIHELDKEGLKVNDKIRCMIDWNKRYKLMRMHTAAHILSAIIHRETNAMITGNQLDEERTRLDFSVEDFKKELFEKFIEEANEEIKKDHKITIKTISKEEAEKMENLSRLAKGLPPNLKEIRIVKIGSIDEQADGGTHVNSTKEIGKIKLLSIENKGKNNRRMYFSLE